MEEERDYFFDCGPWSGRWPHMGESRPAMVLDFVKILAKAGDSPATVKANLALACQYVDAVLDEEKKKRDEQRKKEERRRKVSRLRYSLCDLNRSLRNTQHYRQETLDSMTRLETDGKEKKGKAVKVERAATDLLSDRLVQHDNDIRKIEGKITETEKALRDLGEDPSEVEY